MAEAIRERNNQVNITGITKVLELSDSDWDIAVKLRALTPYQREQFSAALGPAKSSKKSTTKKPAGKGGGGKSSDPLDSRRCKAVRDDVPCGWFDDALIHTDKSLTNYHPFQPKKSKHASSLQQQIQTARPNLDGGVSKMRCNREGCGEYADHNKHHLTTDPDYHEFVAPPAAHAATGATGD